MRVLAGVLLMLLVIGCNGYNIMGIPDDDDTVTDPTPSDDDAWRPTAVPHVHDIDVQPDPEPDPERVDRFLVLDKDAVDIDGIDHRAALTLDITGIPINSIDLPTPMAIAYDTDTDVLLTLASDPFRITTAGPSGHIGDIVLPIEPTTVDFVSPYIVSRSAFGTVVFYNVITGDVNLHPGADRQWISNAFDLRREPGVGMLDLTTGCIVRLDPESDIYSDFLCGLDLADTHAVGSDEDGNYYIGHLGGDVQVHSITSAVPIVITLPDTHRVSSITARDESAVWIYTAVTSASKGGRHLRILHADGGHEVIFYVGDDAWIDLAVIE